MDAVFLTPVSADESEALQMTLKEGLKTKGEQVKHLSRMILKRKPMWTGLLNYLTKNLR